LGGKRELVLVAAALSVESKERSVQPFYVADENLTFSSYMLCCFHNFQKIIKTNITRTLKIKTKKLSLPISMIIFSLDRSNCLLI